MCAQTHPSAIEINEAGNGEKKSLGWNFVVHRAAAKSQTKQKQAKRYFNNRN